MKRTTMSMRQEQTLAPTADSEDERPGPEEDLENWFRAAPVEAFPRNGGGCVKVDDTQIAVFNFSRRGEWFACQNLCPHRKQMILSRGLLGSAQGEPKVACPYHKSTFSLQSGQCLNSDLESIRTYPVRVEDGYVYIDLGPR